MNLRLNHVVFSTVETGRGINQLNTGHNSLGGVVAMVIRRRDGDILLLGR